MPGKTKESPNLFRKTKLIVLVMLAVFGLSFAAGYGAGKLKIADVNKVRSSKLVDLQRNLESKVPLYGPLLQKYRDWERARVFRELSKTKIVRVMFTTFFNNWLIGNLTTALRSAALLPMALYPVGRFFQGLSFAQTRVTYRTWGAFLSDFGGYFFVICGTLCLVLWTLFYKTFHFATRAAAWTGGLKIFLLFFFVSGFVLLFGSYVETMSLVEMVIR
jgi:hypothetical protein